MSFTERPPLIAKFLIAEIELPRRAKLEIEMELARSHRAESIVNKLRTSDGQAASDIGEPCN